jgi:DNA polymerase-3 subunit gamma/tau
MSETSTVYRVLARKYRPTTFADLIGQEAMVRTLSNAIHSGRLAHAFVLTGVRGVGKTTTARIIARALNCAGPDGNGGPTVDPCGVCEHCRAIAEDRHVDVMEMDAASRTGVNDIRELIEGVRYRPTSARFKIYIIDEVHMLSTSAFNALLKTLEEPPEHVKFIFATTEIRKVPVTVLSRCQRFDLKRVEIEVLAKHFAGISEKEGASISPEALALIARAADGSVRDGLSLLDQAISHGDGKVEETQVRDMLGLADRVRSFDLLEAVLKGDIKTGLEILADQYASGADPAVVLEDLLEMVHWLTRLKVTPEAASAPGVPEAERVRGKSMAERLSMPVLARAWQMLLKGLQETNAASQRLAAAEMTLVRLAYVADMPSPAEAVAASRPSPGGGSSNPPAPSGGGGGGGGGNWSRAVNASAYGAPVQAVQSSPSPTAELRSFADVVTLFAEKKESRLAAELNTSVHLVRFEQGLIEINPTARAPRDLANKVGRLLGEWTGQRWVVSISNAPGAPTLHESELEVKATAKAHAAAHPLVQAVLMAFPGATVGEVRNLVEAETETETEMPDAPFDDFSDIPLEEE